MFPGRRCHQKHHCYNYSPENNKKTVRKQPENSQKTARNNQKTSQETARKQENSKVFVWALTPRKLEAIPTARPTSISPVFYVSQLFFNDFHKNPNGVSMIGNDFKGPSPSIDSLGRVSEGSRITKKKGMRFWLPGASALTCVLHGRNPPTATFCLLKSDMPVFREAADAEKEGVVNQSGTRKTAEW